MSSFNSISKPTQTSPTRKSRANSCLPSCSTWRSTSTPTTSTQPFSQTQKTRIKHSPSKIPEKNKQLIPHIHPSTSSVLDSYQVDTAIQIFLYNKLRSGNPSVPPPTSSLPWMDVETLSVHPRGTTIAGWNDTLKRRTVVRISPWNSGDEAFLLSELENGKADRIAGLRQGSHRIWLFGQQFFAGSSYHRGIVPFVSVPMIVGDGNFMVEQYEEILFEKGKRMDLHTFVTEYSRNGSGRRLLDQLKYLYDVLVGVTRMHECGWAHLDVSLENIVISNDHAFIIDFESVLPFGTVKGGFLKRKYLQVPLKTPFVPPEHFVSRGEDMLSLPTYDVWAFGVMLFTVLFGEYLFAMSQHVRNGRVQFRVDEQYIRYFLRHGFKKFMKKFHNDKYIVLFDNPSSFYRAAGNLLSHIFVPACRVRMDDEQEKMDMMNCHGDGPEEERQSEISYWSDRRRFTMEEVMNHQFWSMLAVKENEHRK